MGLDRWCTCIRGRFHIQVKPNHIYKLGNDFKIFWVFDFLSCQLTQAGQTAQFCSILAVWPACVSWQLKKCSSKYFLKSFPALYIWFGLTWMQNQPWIQVYHLSRPIGAQCKFPILDKKSRSWSHHYFYQKIMWVNLRNSLLWIWSLLTHNF